jgi:hypothetical protein
LGIINGDPYGLLKTNETGKKVSHEKSRLISSFEEILDFIDENGREPKSCTDNILEFALYSRLKAIRSDPKSVRILQKYDFKGLFKDEGVKEITVEDIIADDPFNLIGSESDNGIFKLRHVKPSDRIKPDYLSRRKVCNDFHAYKDMFNVLHEELANKKRRLVRYLPSELKAGKFYALDGILLYLKSIDGNVSEYDYSSGERQRFDGRTLCIFDNGTQSDMLYRSLDKAMQLDGYSISDPIENIELDNSTDEADVLNGYIYVLRTKNPKVSDIPNLYKVGYTTGSVAKRIINAKKEATYLFSDVEIVSTFRCFNILTYDLEQTIHDFLSSVRLDIELLDNNNNIYKPKEWFKIDYGLVEEVINLIISDQIDEYEYDARINQIIRKVQ